MYMHSIHDILRSTICLQPHRVFERRNYRLLPQELVYFHPSEYHIGGIEYYEKILKAVVACRLLAIDLLIQRRGSDERVFEA